MIHASTQTARPKLHWTEVVKTEMDYKSIVATGLEFVLFDSFPSEEEFYEYLSGKEEEKGNV